MQDSHIERKLAAVLYADVAGYSRLTGEDEEGTHRLLSAYLDFFTETIQAHGGRVVHFAGDAVLAEFGSTMEAVRCAIRVQRELTTRNESLPTSRRLQFRVGINLGDVMVDRNDIYGDGVNVAARLEGLAEAGGICVSEAVVAQVRNRLDVSFVSLGRQRVKNIAEAVSAYRIHLGKGPAPAQPSRRSWNRMEWPAWLTLIRAIALVGALVVAAGLFVGISMLGNEAPQTASAVAVSPFRTIGARATDALEEGLTEDLITELTRRTELQVIGPLPGAPDGSFLPPATEAEEPRARYQVTGTVQRAEDRVRISAQLVAAGTGVHLWGGRYDRELGDVLALQQDVAERIVSALSEQLVLAEQEHGASAEEGVSLVGLVLAGLRQIGRLAETAVTAAGDTFAWLARLWEGGS